MDPEDGKKKREETTTTTVATKVAWAVFAVVFCGGVFPMVVGL